MLEGHGGAGRWCDATCLLLWDAFAAGDEQPADEHDQNKQVASHRVNVDFKLLIDHVSALEYATERGTSEVSNTVFTVQASLAAPQALQAATTAVQLREALLAATPHRKELDIANALKRRPPASERELQQTEATRPRPSQTQAARARESLASLAVRAGSCLVKYEPRAVDV